MSLTILATDSEGGSNAPGASTDLWNQAASRWNRAAFNWATGTIPSFAVTDLPSLATWIKADGTLWQNSNLTTPATADGARVGAWVPSGGTGGNWLQATAGKRPTLKLAIQNGLPVIRFGAEGGYLTLASQIASVGDFSLFFAMNLLAGASDNLLFSDKADTKWFYQPITGSTSHTANSGIGGSGIVSNSNVWGASVFCLYELHRSGATWTWFRDGLDRTNVAPGANAATFNFGEISGYNGGLFPIVGDLGEIVFCTAFLPVSTDPNANRNACRRYLRDRWGTR